MCGIFGYYQFKVRRTRGEILEALFTGLRRLEYRGYDSAGVSIDADPAEEEAAYENGFSNGNGAHPLPFVRIEATSPDGSPTARDLANSPGAPEKPWGLQAWGGARFLTACFMIGQHRPAARACTRA